MRCSRVALGLVLLLAVGCESNPSSDMTRTPRPTATSESQPASPATDVELETHRVSSIADVLSALENIGWNQVLVLKDGTPNRLLVWESGGHLHARVDYDNRGVKMSLVQAEGEGLPPGKLVHVRSEDGVKSDSGLYWTERGFVIALSPGRQAIAGKLRWVRT